MDDWKKITIMTPGHSRGSCRRQWLRTQGVVINKSPWNENEDMIFKQIIKKYDAKNWNEIVNEFNKNFQGVERTKKQCKERLFEYISQYITKYKYLFL